MAIRVLETLGFTPDVIRNREELPALHAKMNEADLPALAQELGVGEPTLRDIFDALARPERDPRDDLPPPIFKQGVLKLEDLTPGMELKGTVLNVVDFGAFVDIGLKDSGLVHISQIANRYIKSPHDVVSVGDVVTVWVMGVDGERKRVSLTMVKPGTERPRGNQGGGGGPPRPRRVSRRWRATSRRSGSGPSPSPRRPGASPARRRGRRGGRRPAEAARSSRGRRRGGARRPWPRRSATRLRGTGPRWSSPPVRGRARPGGNQGQGPGRFDRTPPPRPPSVPPSPRLLRPRCRRTR